MMKKNPTIDYRLSTVGFYNQHLPFPRRRTVVDLLAVRATAETIARRAGAALLEHYDRPHQHQIKKSYNDLVTEGDMASQAVVVPALREAFPDHHIVSEEGGDSGTPADQADYFWYIDPLDGTSNFASNLPLFSVSIGMADKHLRPLVGVVYDPVGDQLFSASKGGGATRNGQPIQVSTIDNIAQSMLCSGFPYKYATLDDNNLREWDAFHRVSRGIRRLGTIALELCYVAAGRFDGLWEQHVNPWDVMAGIMIVQEAGGTVTDFTGADSDLAYSGKRLLASNGLIHPTMVEMLVELRKDRPAE
ncbi:MAG: inositol monophosphatase [Anaerolineae bacterium]|nr:inositol monophosphatase [Anaerolineae bacterium]